MRFDVAYAREEFADAAGQTTVDDRRGVLGIYAIVNHTF